MTPEQEKILIDAVVKQGAKLETVIWIHKKLFSNGIEDKLGEVKNKVDGIEKRLSKLEKILIKVEKHLEKINGKKR